MQSELMFKQQPLNFSIIILYQSKIKISIKAITFSHLEVKTKTQALQISKKYNDH